LADPSTNDTSVQKQAEQPKQEKPTQPSTRANKARKQLNIITMQSKRKSLKQQLQIQKNWKGLVIFWRATKKI
jgi:hypothetical protein